ncbi:MAG: SagB/ThcOx family dehydrogenase [Pseudonocardiaceae bacterium]
MTQHIDMTQHSPWSAWSFHYATSYHPWLTVSSAPAGTVPKDLLQLPLPQALNTSLGAAIATRASCRRFSGMPLTLEEVSTLLHAGYGVQGHVTVADFEFEGRPVPSAGARYPLELHMIVWSVAGLERGTYRYLPSDHSLERTGGSVPQESVSNLFLGQPYLAGTSAVIVLAATFQRTLARYGDRGYRYILFEAGHIAQNLNLATSALGLGSLNLGGFLDQEVAQALYVTEQVPLYGVALGRPKTTDGQAIRQPPTS